MRPRNGFVNGEEHLLLVSIRSLKSSSAGRTNFFLEEWQEKEEKIFVTS